jgi:Protein of unknown function (DUF5674)
MRRGRLPRKVYTLAYNVCSGGQAVVHIIRSRATPQQIAEMLESIETYIKLAVDVQRELLAGGGVMHADCESALLDDGSQQEDIWGADWTPASQQVTFESLINIRPRQNNRSLDIEDPTIRGRVTEIAHNLLAGI